MDVDRQAGPTINGVMMKTIMLNVIGTVELAVTITILVGTPIAHIVNAKNLTPQQLQQLLQLQVMNHQQIHHLFVGTTSPVLQAP
jgi:hypothetical protein